MSAFSSAVANVGIAMTLSATQAPAVERFIELVRTGQILKSSEFAAVVSVTNSRTLQNAGSCVPDPPVSNDDGSLVFVLWNCKSAAGEKGIATILKMDNGTIKDISVVSADIQPGQGQ